jgi:hypothetical protein
MFLLFLLLLFGVKRHSPAPIVLPINTDSLTQGWARTRAELKDAGDMILKLNKAYRIQAATIAGLKTRLAEQSGGGAGAVVPDKPGWKLYNDSLIIASFSSDTIKYTLKDRPIRILLVENMDNTWSASAYDILLKKEMTIDSISVGRNTDWIPPQTWKAKAVTIAKYSLVAISAASVGYVAGSIKK